MIIYLHANLAESSAWIIGPETEEVGEEMKRAMYVGVGPDLMRKTSTKKKEPAKWESSRNIFGRFLCSGAHMKSVKKLHKSIRSAILDNTGKTLKDRRFSDTYRSENKSTK